MSEVRAGDFIGSPVLEIPGNFEGTFLERHNRFLVSVRVGDRVELVHLHDPGRLKELMYLGNRVLLRKTQGRKTNYSVTALLDQEEWVLVDSRFHNRVAERLLGNRVRRREVEFLGKRMDFLTDGLVEVKGCTLKRGDVALFPDAPTLRGREHMKVLREAVRKGMGALVLVLVFHKYARCFCPNWATDPLFSESFEKAIHEGVKFQAFSLYFDGERLWLTGEVPLCGSELCSRHSS